MFCGRSERCHKNLVSALAVAKEQDRTDFTPQIGRTTHGINEAEGEVTTENEMAAFVERLARRASLKGRHRAVFVGVRPLIERGLDGGHSMKATWEVLHAEGKVTMTYETFRAHCRKAGLGDPAARPGGARARADRQRIVASAAPETPPQDRADDGPRGFQHSRVPRKKDIYG
jgi:hypothetical protein